MRKDEKDFMNYDENGVYPDEKPENGNERTVSDLILSAAVLILFFGTIVYIFVMARQNKGWNAAYAFFFLFLGAGVLGFLSDLIRDKRDNLLNCLVPIGIGVAGIAAVRVFHVGGDSSKFLLVKCFAYGIPLLFAAMGAVYTARYAGYHLSSKDNCTEPVTARCIKAITVSTSRNGTLTSLKYQPRYEYEYDGITYRRTGGKTNYVREKGQEYEILVDPSKPSVFLDPEAEKSGIGSVTGHFLLMVAFPLALMMIFAYCFRIAGI